MTESLFDASRTIIERTAFTANSAGEIGGAALLNGNATLTDCTFVGNTAPMSAGAVFLPSANAIVRRCTFINNTAVYTDSNSGTADAIGTGGALYIAASGLNNRMDSCKFHHNSCSATGGAVYSATTPFINVTHCTFTDNTAATSRGAMFLEREQVVEIYDSSLTGNQATMGGAIATTSGNSLSLQRVLLSGNTAASGGALNVQGDLFCRNCGLSNNTATSQGGAVVGGTGSQLVITNSSCSSNTCKGNGGCVFSASVLQCDVCVVTSNAVVFNGAAIYADFGSAVSLNNSNITSNSAQQSGGAWFGFGSDQALTLLGTTTFSNNTAGCCYASGYGSALQSSNGTSTTSITTGMMTCSDTDTGRCCCRKLSHVQHSIEQLLSKRRACQTGVYHTSTWLQTPTE
jgi:hypothetical protein